MRRPLVPVTPAQRVPRPPIPTIVGPVSIHFNEAGATEARFPRPRVGMAWSVKGISGVTAGMGIAGTGTLVATISLYRNAQLIADLATWTNTAGSTMPSQFSEQFQQPFPAFDTDDLYLGFKVTDASGSGFGNGNVGIYRAQLFVDYA